jgi:hypothetical protein
MTDDGREPEDRVFCFLNPSRECRADCVAFLTIPYENVHVDAVQARCVLLASATTVTSCLIAGTQLLSNWVKFMKNKEADDKRNAVTTQPVKRTT